MLNALINAVVCLVETTNAAIARIPPMIIMQNV